MKKADRKLLDESLSKALQPRKPRRDLNAILDEYDDDKGIPAGVPAGIPTGIPAGVPLSAPAGIPAESPAPKRKAEPETFTYLDATHTAAEKNVYNFMYRETLAKGQTERHFGPAEIRSKLGIGSRNTVHRALYGLIEKLSIEKVAEAHGNPAGPRYRVYHWRDIEQRRKEVGMKIDPQTKQIVAGIPGGIPTGIPTATPKIGDGGIPEIGIPGIPKDGTHINNKEVLNTESANDDDEAFAGLRSAMKNATGRKVTAAAMAELDELLTAEFKLAAGRAEVISAAGAFFAEHLRRRLWKKEKRQIEEEGKSAGGDQAPAIRVDASRCPDCFGTGMWYPEGFDKGVARCGHDKLRGPAEGGG